MKKITDPVAHFWERVEISPKHKCWRWKAGTQSDGYGNLNFKGKSMLAHRVAFMLHGKMLIGPAIQVLHKCDNPICVNPHHLFIGNHSINMQDMWDKNRHVRPVGETNNHAKLTAKDVLRIRDLYSKKLMTQVQIAKGYNVSQANVGCIIRRETWTHI